MLRSIFWTVLAATLIGATAAPAFAQIGGTTGSSLGGTSGGSLASGLSLGSSSTGGSSMGSTGTGGFTGSTANRGGTNSPNSNTGNSGIGSSSTGTLGTTLTTTSYGTTTFQGRYYGDPLGVGVPTTSSVGSQYLRTYPTQLTFGTPLYGTSNQSTTSRSSTNAYGTALTMQASPYGGASSSGTRRAPAYITVPVFERASAPMSASTLRTNLQGIITQSTRLPSRDGISVSMDGPVVVLRGNVKDERERRLAERLLLLTPGVHEVRNELVPLSGPPTRP